MFAMLQGRLPRVTADGVDVGALEADAAAGRVSAAALAEAVERLVEEAVAAQVEAGMGLVTDGAVRWADPSRAVLQAIRRGDLGPDGMLVRAWRATSALTDAPVAQALPGPWSLAVAGHGAEGEGAPGDPASIAARARDLADALAGELEALATAGCPVVQVVEPGAVTLGADAGPGAAFLRTHRRLLARAPEVHAMLLVTGGSAADAGPEVILGAPYRSFLFDLVGGPDNWTLVRAAPPERGIVCAALVAGDGAEDHDQAPQLVWAARYAASAGGRGLDRVGLSNASSLAGLDPAAARRALAALGRAARLAAMPVADAIAAGLDPRTIHTMPTPVVAGGAAQPLRPPRRRGTGPDG